MNEQQILDSIPQLNRVLIFPELESTNDHARILADRDPLDSPVLIVAESQTRGRGRGGNSWFSDQGSLTFSLLAPADLFQVSHGRLALYAGISTAYTLNQASGRDECRLKWPNDVLFAEKKISGILIENVSSVQRCTVIGCGINLNTRFDDYSIDDRNEQQEVTSLAIESGREWNKQQILIEVLRTFFAYLHDDEFYSFNLTRLNCLAGKWVTLSTPGGLVKGMFERFSSDGELVLTISGHSRSFASASVVKIGD